MKPTKKNPFIAKILDRLCDVPQLTWRHMFGGYGLYSGGVFFAILWEERLFFRVDEISEKKYVRRKMEPLKFSDTQKACSYYEVPEAILKNRKTAAEWANEAVAVQNSRLAKAAVKKRTRQPQPFFDPL